jgi:sulfatase modifying factor 1
LNRTLARGRALTIVLVGAGVAACAPSVVRVAAPSANPRRDPCAAPVFVPRSEVLLGASPDDPLRDDDERAVGPIPMGPMWVDACPVTVMDFARAAQHVSGTPGAVFLSESQTPTGWLGRCNLGSSRANHPMNCVNALAARAYCHARGGDLPTEAEWEAFAKHHGREAFPWGPTFGVQRVVSSVPCGGRGCAGGTQAVGSDPGRCFPSGACDVVGNVWQWTRSPYAAELGQAAVAPKEPVGDDGVIKGGGWLDEEPARFRPAFRGRVYAKHGLSAVGFRCVYRALPDPSR